MALNKINIIKKCFIFLNFVALVTLPLTGCCGYKKTSIQKSKSNSYADSIKKSYKKEKVNLKGHKINDFNDIDIDITGDLSLSSRNEHISELYNRLDYANKLFKKTNYDGALRELSRIQQENKDDPYLKMQSWALIAKIYDKTGKTSRRKRSYNKMMEAMSEVWKDSRYIKAYEDGMICQSLIASATKNGDKKYGFE